MGWEVALVVYFGVGLVMGFKESTSKKVKNTAVLYAFENDLSTKSFARLYLSLAVIVFVVIFIFWLPNLFWNLLPEKKGGE